MLSSTAFPAPYNSVPILSRSATLTHTCHSLAPTRVIHFHSSFFEFQQFRQSHVNLRAAYGAGFVASAVRRKGRGGAGVARREDDPFDEEEKEDDDDDYYDDDDDFVVGNDDDGEGVLPLEQMQKWLRKKPKGFGEGKVYDTSVEDKLLEEMRKSREAQEANLEKLKSNPVKPASKKTDQKKKDPEVVTFGGRVRLVNLPKKKNIHRDLKSALEGIPGIMNIVPLVTGNKKTRDPICKGLAFVDFKHEADAVRFVELYSGQTITFGKTQKQIKCELVNAQSSSSASLESSKNLKAVPRLMVSAPEEVSNEDSNVDDTALSSWNGTTSDDSDDPDNEMYEEVEDLSENEESATSLVVDSDDDDVEMRIDSEMNSLSIDQVNGNPTTEEHKSSAKAKREIVRKKKQTSKGKAKKVPKLDIPGSAKRLKIKEKAVLSDVFSKYGSKAALASKDS